MSSVCRTRLIGHACASENHSSTRAGVERQREARSVQGVLAVPASMMALGGKTARRPVIRSALRLFAYSSPHLCKVRVAACQHQVPTTRSPRPRRAGRRVGAV